MSKPYVDKSVINNISVGNINIDGTDPNNLSNKVVSEKDTRKNFLKHARIMGCEQEMLNLFVKYDNLLRNCTNEKERIDIGKLGALEVYKLLGGGGELYVNGELVSKES